MRNKIILFLSLLMIWCQTGWAQNPRPEIIIFAGGGGREHQRIFSKVGETLLRLSRTSGSTAVYHFVNTGREIVDALNTLPIGVPRKVFIITHSGSSLLVDLNREVIDFGDGSAPFELPEVHFELEEMGGIYLRVNNGFYNTQLPAHPGPGAALFRDISPDILQTTDFIFLGCNSSGLARRMVELGAKSAYGTEGSSDFFKLDGNRVVTISPEEAFTYTGDMYLAAAMASRFKKNKTTGEIQKNEEGLRSVKQNIRYQWSLVQPGS